MESEEMQTVPVKHLLRSWEKKREMDWNRRLEVGSLSCLQAEGDKPLEREVESRERRTINSLRGNEKQEE